MDGGLGGNRTAIGEDAEQYLSRLWLLHRNPNGTRRPDLVSQNGTYTPKFTMEVKSGQNHKGVLHVCQLHYAHTLTQDYEDEDTPRIKGLNWSEAGKVGRIAYYYSVINRRDDVKSRDLFLPFSSLKFEWGSQYVVPHEYGFFAFARGMAHQKKHRSVRTVEDIHSTIEYLQHIVKQDVAERSSHYSDRRVNTGAWQTIFARDIEAIFAKDDELTTKDGKQRLSFMRAVYPELDDLIPIEILGPNNTTIYVLSKKEDVDLFNEQARSHISSRVPILNSVYEERRECLPLLEKVKQASKTGELFPEMPPEKELHSLDISIEEWARLERISMWIGNGDDSQLNTDGFGVPF